MSKQVLLGSLDRVGQALFEDELIIFANCYGDHERVVGWEGPWCVQLDELSQEEVLWVFVIADDVFDHHNCVR